MKHLTAQLAAALLICAAAQSRGEIRYTITDLGVLSGPGAYPSAINAEGEVVGHADLYNMYSHAFLYTGSGALINLGSFAGDSSVSEATGINNSGTVVGQSDSGASAVAFVYTQSTGMVNLGTLGGQYSDARAVNNYGQIVGVADTAGGYPDGFIYSPGGQMTDLGPYQACCINDSCLVAAVQGSGSTCTTYLSSGGTGAWVNIGSLGGTYTAPYGMNNLGEVVGGSSVTTANGGPQPFVFSGGTMTNLGTFGGQTGVALGVNDLGVVIGGAEYPGDSLPAPFVYYGTGSIENLNDLVNPSLGWTIDSADAINDSGQIAGCANRQGGDYDAVLLDPIITPEPSSLCLAVGAGAVFFTIRAFIRLLGSGSLDTK